MGNSVNEIKERFYDPMNCITPRGAEDIQFLLDKINSDAVDYGTLQLKLSHIADYISAQKSSIGMAFSPDLMVKEIEKILGE